MSQQSNKGDVKQVTVTYNGECFTVCPITLRSVNELLRGFKEGEVSTAFGVDTPPVLLTTPDELVGALSIRAGNKNALVLKQLNVYFGVSFPSLETGWKEMCVGED